MVLHTVEHNDYPAGSVVHMHIGGVRYVGNSVATSVCEAAQFIC